MIVTEKPTPEILLTAFTKALEYSRERFKDALKNKRHDEDEESLRTDHEMGLCRLAMVRYNYLASDGFNARLVGHGDDVVEVFVNTLPVIAEVFRTSLTLQSMREYFDQGIVFASDRRILMDIESWPPVVVKQFWRKWDVKILPRSRTTDHKHIIIDLKDIEKLDKLLRRMALGFPKIYKKPIFKFRSCVA